MSLATLVCNLIMRTGQFEAGAKKADNSLYGLTKSALNAQRSMVSLMKVGFGGAMVMAVTRVAHDITEAHKAFRESERSYEDFKNLIVESIPFFGRAARAIREMAEEISGLNQAKEESVAMDKTLGKIADSFSVAKNQADKIGLSDKDLKKLEAFQEYEKSVKGISDLVKEIEKTMPALNAGKMVEGLEESYFKVYKDKIQKIIDAPGIEKRNKQLKFWQDLREEIKNTTYEVLGYTEIEQKMMRLQDDALKLFHGKELNDVLDSINTLWRGLEKADAMKDVKSALESIMSPLEKYEQKLKEIWGWYEKGLISGEQYNDLISRIDLESFRTGDNNIGQGSMELLPMGSAIPSSLASQTPILQSTAESTKQTAANTRRIADNGW